MGDGLDLVLHFDGSCNPNPGGRMGYGWHLDTAAGVRVGEYRGEVLGYPPEHRTNNTAEPIPDTESGEDADCECDDTED